MMIEYPESARSFDDIGDEQKKYESNKLDYFIPYIPIVARLDGKAFHKFTKNLEKPMDKNLMQCMKQTTIELCKYFQADLGYTQSDEITLIWFNPTPDKLMFNGRVEKYTSLLASVCTAHFNKLVQEHIPSKANTLAYFDTRMFQVPNRQKAFENVCWRQLDCIKNSISSYAYANFSAKSLIGKNSKARKGMLFDNGVDWETEPPENKYGIFVGKVKRIKIIDELPYKWDESNIIDLPDGGKGVERNEYTSIPSISLKSINDVVYYSYIDYMFSESVIPELVINYITN